MFKKLLLFLSMFLCNVLFAQYVVKDSIIYIETRDAYVGFHLSAAFKAASDFDTEFSVIRDSLVKAVYEDTGILPMLDKLNETHVSAVNYLIVIDKVSCHAQSRKEYKRQRAMLRALSYGKIAIRYKKYKVARVVRKAIRRGKIEEYIRSLIRDIRADNVEGLGEWRYHRSPNIYNN